MGRYKPKERESVMLHCDDFRKIQVAMNESSVLKVLNALLDYSDSEKAGKEFSHDLHGIEQLAYDLLKKTVDEGISSFNKRRETAISNRQGGLTEVDHGQQESTAVDSGGQTNENEIYKIKTNENGRSVLVPSIFSFRSSLGMAVSDSDLRQWQQKGYPDPLIKQAMKIAHDSGRTDARYVVGVLRNIESEGGEDDEEERFNWL